MARLRLNRFEVGRGQLPLVCMFCGECPAAEKRITFSWYPRWINVLVVPVFVPPLMVFLVPLAIALALLTKRMTVYVPICDQHRNHWRHRRLIIRCGWLLLVAAAVGLALLVLAYEKRFHLEGAFAGTLCVEIILLPATWLVFTVVFQRGRLRPSEITDRTITLVGVHPAFIEALKQQDEDENRLPTSRRRARTQPEDRERFFGAPPDPPETIRKDES